MAKGDLFQVRQSVFVQTSDAPLEDPPSHRYSYTRYPFREVTRYGVPVRGRAIRKNWETLPDSMRVHNPSSELVALANEAISMEPKPGKVRQEVTNFITSLEKMKSHHFPHGSEVTMLLPGSRWPFSLTVRSEDEARKLGEKALSIGVTQMVLMTGKNANGETFVYRGSKSPNPLMIWKVDRARTEKHRNFRKLYY